jgi:hypothetical protein
LRFSRCLAFCAQRPVQSLPRSGSG